MYCPKDDKEHIILLVELNCSISKLNERSRLVSLHHKAPQLGHKSLFLCTLSMKVQYSMADVLQHHFSCQEF